MALKLGKVLKERIRNSNALTDAEENRIVSLFAAIAGGTSSTHTLNGSYCNHVSLSQHTFQANCPGVYGLFFFQNALTTMHSYTSQKLWHLLGYRSDLPAERELTLEAFIECTQSIKEEQGKEDKKMKFKRIFRMLDPHATGTVRESFVGME